MVDHPPFHQQQLSNGLTIVIEPMADVSSVALGFLARTGARDEHPGVAGVSHFLEHMCFKGTARRTWQNITIDFDTLGSTYNAYTSKDRTFYYGWVPAEKLEQQLELLADMMRSSLPTEEFDMEKKVVLEEIAMAGDQLDSLAYDFLHEQVYADQSLAWPVLGYEQTIAPLTRDQMNEYLQRRYSADNLILIVAGRVDPLQVTRLAERYCGGWPRAQITAASRNPPLPRPGQSAKVVERFTQQVIAEVFPCPGGRDPWNETAEVLVSILGGENSRCFWNIVQQGIAPRAGAFRMEYEDGGLIILTGQCDPADSAALLTALRLEAQRITREGVTEVEVQRVKNRMRTGLAIEGEAPYYRLSQLMDDVDYRGRPRTVGERLAAVDAVTPQMIADYLREFPITTGGHLISVGPRHWLPD
ncbi:MAG: putative zinc protease [Phycisphaerae bacterium]|nr:putative zinc protease [Phycisphaerae bacterium]